MVVLVTTQLFWDYIIFLPQSEILNLVLSLGISTLLYHLSLGPTRGTQSSQLGRLRTCGPQIPLLQKKTLCRSGTQMCYSVQTFEDHMWSSNFFVFHCLL